MAHKNKPQSEFSCIDCYHDYPFSQNVILPNYIWASIADTYDLLCLSCIQGRLGRKLKPSDFPDRLVTVYRGVRLNVRTIPLNEWFFERMGWKLKANSGYWFKRKKNLWRNKNV